MQKLTLDRPNGLVGEWWLRSVDWFEYHFSSCVDLDGKSDQKVSYVSLGIISMCMI